MAIKSAGIPVQALAHAATTSQTVDDHHNQAHTVASHSDTTGTGAELETLTDGSTTALHDHAAHTVASHSDTTGTGAELETLTDGSTTALHAHSGGTSLVVQRCAFAANGTLVVGDVNTETLTRNAAGDYYVTFSDAVTLGYSAFVQGQDDNLIHRTATLTTLLYWCHIRNMSQSNTDSACTTAAFGVLE